MKMSFTLGLAPIAGKLTKVPSAGSVIPLISTASGIPSPSVSCTVVLKTTAPQVRQSLTIVEEVVTCEAFPATVTGTVKLSQYAPCAPVNGLLYTVPLMFTLLENGDGAWPSPTM